MAKSKKKGRPQPIRFDEEETLEIEAGMKFDYRSFSDQVRYWMKLGKELDKFIRPSLEQMIRKYVEESSTKTDQEP